MHSDDTHEVFYYCIRVPSELFCQGVQDGSGAGREQSKESGFGLVIATKTFLDEPCERMAVELPREN